MDYYATKYWFYCSVCYIHNRVYYCYVINVINQETWDKYIGHKNGTEINIFY